MKKLLLPFPLPFLYYPISFLLPFLVMFFVLLSVNISWGSETTILASDGFHQYVIFAQNLRNILHGSDSIFYTFTSGLGLNFYALISYYLGSFLSPFVYFFDIKNMPDAIYLFTLTKIGLIGLSSYYSLKELYKKVSKLLILVLSTSYALMSFSISQIEINMWLDVFILVPLIILGLHRLLEKRHFKLYYIGLTVLFIQNYYFGYMMSIFLVFYFLVQLTLRNKWIDIKRNSLDFTVVSILAGLSSAVMLLPSYLDLSTHGEKFTKFTGIFTDSAWYLDIFAKNFVGSYDTTKFGAIPMVYVGILPFILAILFFTIKSIRWQVRLAYGLMVIFIIASFYIQPLDLIWQGMHAPNMFLHRYAWIFSTVIILLAAETLSHIEELSLKQIIICLTPVLVGFIATVVLRSHYDFLKTEQFVITFAFLAAYSILLISYIKRYLTSGVFISFVLLFAIFEMSLNTYYQISALNSEWVFPSREGYERNLTEIDNIVNETKKENTIFYRMERLIGQTGNDSMKYNYNGISQFSSIRNTASSSILDRLGFKSSGTNLNLRYQNNTLLMDSLFAVKYNIAQTTINKFGFKLVDSSGSTSLYKNQNASQLAILTNGVYKDINFSINTLDNQTNLINNLTGLSKTYFTRAPSQLMKGGTLFNNLITATNNGKINTSVTYQVTVPENTQLYVSMPNITFTNNNSTGVQVTVNGVTSQYTTDDAYSLFDIGTFSKGEPVMVTFTFPENNQVSFNSPNFYNLNLENYQKAMNIINSKDVTVTTQNNTVTAVYKTSQDASLFFTIPYDKGWVATQNGVKIPISKAQDGFMKVNVKTGKGKVVLTFIPNGLKEGALLSLLGISLFLFYHFFCKKKQQLIK